MRKNKQSFDISISFSSDDNHIARNLIDLLSDFNVYLSTENPDYARGELNSKLRDIYNKSMINVMLWSESYKKKQEDVNSVINLESKLLLTRHIKNRDDESLFILNVDDTPISNEFFGILFHNYKKFSLYDIKKFIVDRLLDAYNVNEPLLGEPFHPNNCKGHRCQMSPCDFRLSANYQQKNRLNRWESLGDMLVVPLGTSIPKELKTFLIPSAGTPPFLSHSTLIKTNPRALFIKQNVSCAFYEEYKGKDLKGFLFNIEDNGMEYPHMYYREYDIFLRDNWRKYDINKQINK